MLFFFPYSTDAPVYYWPVATVGMIAANVAIFIAMAAGVIAHPDEWILTYGSGLHAHQWLTSMFMHGSVGHLVANMFFLWVFGLIVEGKLGWRRFVACYLGIGILQAMLQQLIMLGYSGDVPGSLGASSAIFGLMAMAAVWAPMNEVTFFYVFIIRFGTFDVSVLMLAGVYTGIEALLAIFFGGSASSSLLHVSGFAVGLPLGVVLLRRGIVDCEGWDLFHVWRGDYGSFKTEEDPRKLIAETNAKLKARDEKLLAEAKLHFQNFLEAGNSAAAVKLLEKMRNVGAGLQLDRSELVGIIRALHSAKRWSESAPYMNQLIQLAPEQADPVRVKLAQICVVELQRPARALELIESVNLEKLNEQQRALAHRIKARAQQMQAEGAFELDVEF